jgi:flagellar assembly protein FliH
MPVANLKTLPVTTYSYRQIVSFEPEQPAVKEQMLREPDVQIPESVYHSRLAKERAAAAAEVEARLRGELERQKEVEASKISAALKDFGITRAEYFASLEAEVVNLALAVARRILHREAQVDPMLVAALVQLALGQFKDGSKVVLRVSAGQAARWERHFAAANLPLSISIESDATMEPGDCVLQTELGTAAFGIDAQLKEVEKGFLDVLALRPQA